jgi:hypothetical protein
MDRVFGGVTRDKIVIGVPKGIRTPVIAVKVFLQMWVPPRERFPAKTPV